MKKINYKILAVLTAIVMVIGTVSVAGVSALEEPLKNEYVIEVEEMIAGLPEVKDFTLEDEDFYFSITVTSYNSLSPEDQNLVSNSDKLMALIEKIDALKNPISEYVGETIALIDALPSVEDLKVEDKAELDLVNSLYIGLSVKEKSHVTNSSKLAELLEKMEEISYVPSEYVGETIALIDALPSVEDLKVEDKADLDFANSLYQGLSVREKSHVTNSSKLAELLEKMEEILYVPSEYVGDTIALIDALPSVEDLKVEDKADLDFVNSLYQVLSVREKSHVTNSSKLAALLEKMEEISYVPSEYVEDAIALIESLPSVEELTLDDEYYVNLADSLYQSLSDREKSHVTNSSELKLLVEKIKLLKYEETPKAKELAAIEELKEAGITSNFYFDLINKAKTVEGVAALKDEIINSMEDTKEEIPLTPLEPSTPVEKEEDVPLTPLEPSTPIEDEKEDEDIPLIPLEPSTPIEDEKEEEIPLTPLVPSTPVEDEKEEEIPLTPLESSNPIKTEEKAEDAKDKTPNTGIHTGVMTSVSAITLSAAALFILKKKD